MGQRDSRTVRRCAFPGCKKIATNTIPGGLLGACSDHIALARFVAKIHGEIDFHTHAE